MQRTILVVDDAPICREPIAASLRLAGFKTLAAGNGQEALDLIARSPVDLVLLDVAMPVMDGLTVLRKIRENPKHANLPIIMLTVAADQSFRINAAPLRPADYLLKSHFCLQDLLARVNKHLRAAA
jgi:DNA-binding response OmpR family regulator